MIVTLTKLFRVLLITYFLGSGILISLSLGLQQFQAEKRAALQLQQYAELLKVSLRPILAQGAWEQLSNQLLELHYSALLPVAALGIYDPDGEPLATTGLKIALPTHLSATPTKYAELPLLAGRTAAIVPLASHSMSADPLMSYQNSAGYLVIVPEDIPEKQPFLLLTMLVWLSYSLLFLGFAWYLQQWLRQRNASLTELLATAINVQGTEAATPIDSAQTNTKLPKELKAVQHHLTLLAERFSAEQLVQQQQSLELLRLQGTLLQMTEQQQHAEQQWQLLQKDICLWLAHTQLIWQRQEQFSPPVFFALMRLQLLDGLYQFNPPAHDATAITLSDWLAHQIPDLNHLLPHAVSIDWLEGDKNNSLAVKFDSAALQAILQALLLLALRSENLTRIALRLSLTLQPEPQLLIQLNCDGQGLAPALHQQLKSAQAGQWQWRDIDVVLLQRLATAFNAKLNVQSLEGLGLSVKLPIPVDVTELSFQTKMGHVFLFDEDTERLSERILALKALAIQVTGCHTFSELEPLIKKSLPDLLLVMLPDTAPSQQWLTCLSQYQQQNTAYFFAPTRHLAQWQACICCYSAAEFCLALLTTQPVTAKPAKQEKKLLVVDDNETNQAFIRILLQHKTVDFLAALTGEEALQLCQQQPFDLILLDISLPDMSGVDVARQLRRLPAYEKTPILAFTAHALPAEIAEFKLAGMDDILLKPLDPAKFETLLARYQLY